MPDVSRILEECPKLNVTVALGIDGLKEDHEKIRGKAGSWDKAISTARQLQEIQREIPRLDVQTCTCFMNSNQDRIFEWYDFLRYELKPDKINVNYIRPPSANAEELNIDLARYRQLAARIDDDSRHGVIKNHYKWLRRLPQGSCRHLYARADRPHRGDAEGPTPLLRRHDRWSHLR
jgi:sulfatase maturation enzyme AslB (radical SAM superfamily)